MNPLKPLTQLPRPHLRAPQPEVDVRRLAARVTALEAAVDENRRLNQRLADVLDVVTELLVPAVDRDDERLVEALRRLGRTLDEPPAGDPAG